MTATDYSRIILDALRGETTELRHLPQERLDWSGAAGVLRLYRQSSGVDRSQFITALSDILGQEAVPSTTLAELVNIASGLEISQVEPAVRALQRRAEGADGPLRRAVTNYLEFRKLAVRSCAATDGVSLADYRPAGVSQPARPSQGKATG